MIDLKIFKQSLLYAVLAVSYVACIATLMNNAEGIVGNSEKGVLAPIGFLLLLVVSAATMGMLVFGKPVMLYIDGKKQESVKMVLYTIGIIATCTILLFLSLVWLA